MIMFKGRKVPSKSQILLCFFFSFESLLCIYTTLTLFQAVFTSLLISSSLFQLVYNVIVQLAKIARIYKTPC